MTFQRKLVFTILAAIFAGVILGVIAGIASIRQSSANGDSGVKACQEIADRQAKSQKAAGTMTEESYREKRAPFADSKHTDLNAAGTSFVDVVWESQQALANEDTDLMVSITALTKIENRYAALQIACQNHGVKLKDLSG